MKRRCYGMIFVLISLVMISAITMSFPFMGIRPGVLFYEACNRIEGNPSVWAGELTDKFRSVPSAWAQEVPIRPDLSIVPAEIDLGQLWPGGIRKGIFVLKKSVPGDMDWSLIAPEGWSAAQEKVLAGSLKTESDLLRFQLKIVRIGTEGDEESETSGYSGQLLFETGVDSLAFTRNITPGHHRELVRLRTGSGPKAFYILYKFVDATPQPQLSIDPYHLDFGSATLGEPVSKRVRVTNKGWETLRWRAIAGSTADAYQAWPVNPGKYVSFLNEMQSGNGHYTIARHLKDKIELLGKWAEDQGFPLAASEGQTLRYHFSGTGIAVCFWKGPATGQLTAFVDDRFILEQNGFSEQRERTELMVAEGLADGEHLLTLINRNGPVTVEGVRVYGKEIMQLLPWHVAISPDHGAVTRQTNYVNITLNTKPLQPGHYGGRVIFDSNGGQKEIELSLDVMADNVPRTIDVYRYVRNLDYFLTTNPQAESAVLQSRGYTKQGIAFRLFSPGVPGTTEFYRWFHPQKGDHFYGYELKNVKRPMDGYILEGTIGNIATSRLAQTRELYRWYNPSNRHYFFSIDPKGEGVEKKGYRYDGIAGYVRP